MSLSDKLANRKFPTKDVQLCLDGQLSQQRDIAMGEVTEAVQKSSDRLARDGGVKVAQQRVAEIEEAMRESLITIRVTGLPFAEYNKCMHANPPRKGKQEAFNVSTFFLYVAKRSSQYIDDDGAAHDISDEDWAAIEVALTDGEHDLIAGAVVEVNRTQGLQGVGFLGRVSPTTPDSSVTSESPAPSE